MLALIEASPVTGYRMLPNLERTIKVTDKHFFKLTTDARGYRSPKAPITAFGCSQTFGWGVGDTAPWPAQLAEAIGKPVGNLSAPGWSLACVARAVAAEGPFDTVIVGHYQDTIARSVNACFIGSHQYCLTVPYVKKAAWVEPDVKKNASLIAGERHWWQRSKFWRLPDEAEERSVTDFLYEEIAKHCKRILVVWIPDAQQPAPPPAWIAGRQVVDSYPALCNPSWRFGMQIPVDLHLSVEGHHQVAKLIAPLL